MVKQLHQLFYLHQFEVRFSWYPLLIYLFFQPLFILICFLLSLCLQVCVSMIPSNWYFWLMNRRETMEAQTYILKVITPWIFIDVPCTNSRNLMEKFNGYLVLKYVIQWPLATSTQTMWNSRGLSGPPKRMTQMYSLDQMVLGDLPNPNNSVSPGKLFIWCSFYLFHNRNRFVVCCWAQPTDRFLDLFHGHGDIHILILR